MVDLCNVSRRRKEAKEKEKEKKERTSFSSRQLALSASLPLQWFVRSSFHDNTEYQMPVIRRVAVIEARRGPHSGRGAAHPHSHVIRNPAAGTSYHGHFCIIDTGQRGHTECVCARAKKHRN